MINKTYFQNPGKEHRIDVRWWLAEGFHTDQTLLNDVRMLDESGFGAIEFLAMEEPGADSKLYGWGSEEWIHDSKLLIEEATKRDMGFSVTSGTNWANTNLTSINPDDKAASKELDYVVEMLEPLGTWDGELPRAKIVVEEVHEQILIAVVAARILETREGKVYLDENTMVLTDLVKDGRLFWQAPGDGCYNLFFFWLHGTGQTAGPSVSTSYSINYMDKYGAEAFIDYWNKYVLTEDLRKTISENPRAMMYMDSLELTAFGKGGQLWGYHFIEAFRRARGYDITPYLPFVVIDSGIMLPVLTYHFYMQDEVKNERILNDLYQTMTECYMENMLKPIQAWLHSVGMTLRSEVAYGLPLEVSQSSKYVDGLETESLEFASQIESYRNLSGPAHIYNKIYSSETGATRRNYMMGMEFYTQIIYTQFAAGVSRTVMHGYSSICGSDESTYWPGHEGMWPLYSERFGCRQPAYRHYNDWANAMARYQYLIRRGKPRVDLGILRLDYNLNNLLYKEDELEQYTNRLMRADEGMYWKDMELQHAGYTWDYFAPQLLEEPFTSFKNGELYHDGPGYHALVIYQEYMPVTSARKLLALAKEGLNVVFVNGVTETIRPKTTKYHKKAASLSPFLAESDEALHKVVEEIKALPNVLETDVQAETIECLRKLGVKPRASFSASNKNILMFMNETEEDTSLFVYNMLYTEKTPTTVTIEIAGEGKPYIADCWNAELHSINSIYVDGRTCVTLTLKPGEATMILLDRSSENWIEPTKKTYGTVLPLKRWDLVVEDWNEGDKKTITEDRGLGIVTNEVYYETRKTLLYVGNVELKPWREYAVVGQSVSGVGTYRTKVSLPMDWSERDGAELHIGSTNGNTAAVYINGKKARAVDFNKRIIDISEFLVAGENEIKVEVSSTLTNRLLSRDYYIFSNDYSKRLALGATNANEHEKEGEPITTTTFTIVPEYQDYGMMGTVEILFYQTTE